MKIPPNPSPSPIFQFLLSIAPSGIIVFPFSCLIYRAVLRILWPYATLFGPYATLFFGGLPSPLLLYIILLYKYIYTLLNTVCFLCCDHSRFIRHRPTGGDLGAGGRPHRKEFEVGKRPMHPSPQYFEKQCLSDAYESTNRVKKVSSRKIGLFLAKKGS